MKYKTKRCENAYQLKKDKLLKGCWIAAAPHPLKAEKVQRKARTKAEQKINTDSPPIIL